MVFPDKTNLEVDDSDEDSIEDTKTSWFVWLVAFTASIAGSLFGYDTGIISAVLVYLGTDLGGHETSPNEKELITSLCSGGAFIGAIIAGLTADKFVSLLFSLKTSIATAQELFLWQREASMLNVPHEYFPPVVSGISLVVLL